MIEPVLPTYLRAPMTFSKGRGCWLYDEKGEAYLDAGGGIAVVSLGHAHPELVSVLHEQAGKLWHTSNLYRISGQESLADKLVKHTFADTVFFTNSGTEAMEATVKMARKYWHAKGITSRREIITLKGSFHGRSLGMISASGSAKLTNGFDPLLPGFTQVELGDMNAITRAVNEHTAAILLEPVLGEGGIIPLQIEYLRSLRRFCDETGILLLLDEIQCGMGRTGKLFAHEWADITPDIMGIAKGIGGGFPLGACLATSSAAIGMTAGSHGSTFGGNPLACAVGARVLDIITSRGFMQDVQDVAAYLREGLQSVADKFPDQLVGVRGSGLMLGLMCTVNNLKLVAAGHAMKVLTIPGGDNVVRILPPLVINKNEAGEIVFRIEKAVKSLKGKDNA